ncbi:hypothetical protein ACQ86N_28225 [Puia sp. P3]|uniref:hypothetical protein n=1 Tax=Puia sp. P3 TaxID=3423952 RepID=UPI003D67581F
MKLGNSFDDLGQKKKIDFAFATNVAGLSVFFDRDKTERILFNLLSNAFKFTPEGAGSGCRWKPALPGRMGVSR